MTESIAPVESPRRHLEPARNGFTQIAALSMLAGAMCLAMSAVFVKLADVDAATTALLRCAMAAVVLVPLAIWERHQRGGQSRVAIGWSVIAGIALGIDYASWTVSIYAVGTGISTVLINVQVIVLPALAWAFDRCRPSRRFLLAVPAMLIGVALVGGVGTTSTQVGDRVVSGTLLGVLAGVGYGTYLYLTRRSNNSSPGLIIQSLCWATCSAAITTAVIAAIGNGIHLASIGGRSWAYLIGLALLGQVFAWVFINRGSARLTPAASAALLLIQPILTLILSALLLSEYPRWLQLAGAAVIIVAIAVANNVPTIAARFWRRRRHRPSPNAP